MSTPKTFESSIQVAFVPEVTVNEDRNLCLREDRVGLPDDVTGRQAVSKTKGSDGAAKQEF